MIGAARFAVCADWAKGVAGRAVWVADPWARTVSRLVAPTGWTFRGVVEAAERRADGPALIAFDVPLGVPASYLEAWNREVGEAAAFPDLLRYASRRLSFFEPCTAPDEWRVERPFFRVAAGRGGRDSFFAAAAGKGVDLLRRIDGATGAKAMFIVSGIPGSVGSATAALWREVAEARELGARCVLWPFERERDDVSTVAEIYPRLAYAEALEGRVPRSKRDRAQLGLAVEALLDSRWARGADVRFEGLDAARVDDDEFDACVTAAALLRRRLEGAAVAAGGVDERAEGSMLLV